MEYTFRTPKGLITVDSHETNGSLLKRGALPDKWCVIRRRPVPASIRPTPNANHSSAA